MFLNNPDYMSKYGEFLHFLGFIEFQHSVVEVVGANLDMFNPAGKDRLCLNISLAIGHLHFTK